MRCACRASVEGGRLCVGREEGEREEGGVLFKNSCFAETTQKYTRSLNNDKLRVSDEHGGGHIVRLVLFFPCGLGNVCALLVLQVS